MTGTHLHTLELDPPSPALGSVIWMHGLGADATDFLNVPAQLGLPAEFPIRYIFPNAPEIPVTINMGTVMRAWYDITTFEPRAQDEPGIRLSAQHITELIDFEATRGVPTNKIVLAGFSQGGAMSLFTGLRYQKTLAGILCLSAYLPLLKVFSDEVSAANARVPIFQAHGVKDTVVTYVSGRRTCEHLESAGYPVEWHEYQMAHQVCQEELCDIASWLRNVFDMSSIVETQDEKI